MKGALNRHVSVIVVIFLLCTLGGCGSLGKIINFGTDTRTDTLNALDDAITALQSQSANWQQVLKDTESKLTKDAQSTLKNEIADLLSRTVAQGGVELRCDADFIQERIREELVRMKAEFLGQTAPAVDPAFCQVVPLAVDRELIPDRLKDVEFYGYNFNQASGLGVFLENTSGGRTNITGKLDKPTTYAMTLKFGADGIQLDNTSARLVLEWGGKQVSSVAVIQPTTPVCASKPFTVPSMTVGPYIPPKVGQGDADFDGNGPNVTSNVLLNMTPQALTARVYMHAKETKSDWTEAEGWTNYTLYTPEPGWKIEQVGGKTSSSHHYVDATVDQQDSFDMGTGGLVRRFLYVGDTGGDEAGTKTSVTVTFNDIPLVLTQTGNCVPDTAVAHLQSAGMLGARTFTRLNSAAVAEVGRRSKMMMLATQPK